MAESRPNWTSLTPRSTRYRYMELFLIGLLSPTRPDITALDLLDRVNGVDCIQVVSYASIDCLTSLKISIEILNIPEPHSKLTLKNLSLSTVSSIPFPYFGDSFTLYILQYPLLFHDFHHKMCEPKNLMVPMSGATMYATPNLYL